MERKGLRGAFHFLFLFSVAVIVLSPRVQGREVECSKPVQHYIEALSTCHTASPSKECLTAPGCVARLLPPSQAIPLLHSVISQMFDWHAKLNPENTEGTGSVQVAFRAAKALASIGDPSGFEKLCRWFSSLDFQKVRSREALRYAASAGYGADIVSPVIPEILEKMPAVYDDSTANEVCVLILYGHRRKVNPDRKIVMALLRYIERMDDLLRKGPRKDTSLGSRFTAFRGLVVQMRGLGPEGVPHEREITESQQRTLREAREVAWPSPLPDFERERLTKDLSRILSLFKKDMTYSAWKGRKEATCRTFSGDSFHHSPSEVWCTECEILGEKWKAHFYFYPDLSRNDCTLMQMTIFFHLPDKSLMKDLEKSVSDFLGKKEELQSSDDINVFGCGSWYSIRRWKRKENLAYLYLDGHKERYGGSPWIGFLWRRSPLLEKEEKEYEDDFSMEHPTEDEWKEVALNACREASLSGCSEAAAAIKERQADGIDQALNSALQALQNTGEKSVSFPPLAFWVDALADARSLVRDLDHKAWQKRRNELKRFGLEYRDYHLAGRPLLLRTLLKKLALHHKKSFWGRVAFLKMTRRGWEVGGACENGSDDFRLVIRYGEEFLRSYPDSEVSRAVLLEVARAYETWWSLSRASRDPYVDPRRYRSGADNARKNAIRLYKSYLTALEGRAPRTGKTAGKGVAAIFEQRNLQEIEEKIFRLKRGVDTNQRRYFCIYD